MESKTLDFMENGHLSDNAAALMVDALLQKQGLDVNVPEEVLNHVEECGPCKDKIIDVVTFLRNPDPVSRALQKRRLIKVLKGQKAGGPGKRYFYPGRIAAVFVVFAFLVSTYFLVYKNPSMLEVNRYKADGAGENQQKQEMQIKKSDSRPGERTGSEEKLVESKPVDEPAVDKKKRGQRRHSWYSVNANLENMIGSRLRSGLFEVLTPGDNRVLKVPIHFSWKDELSGVHTLKIVNNKNVVLYKHLVQGRSYDFTGKLRGGLYYWKMESRSELLYVGKFFISTEN